MVTGVAKIVTYKLDSPAMEVHQTVKTPVLQSFHLFFLLNQEDNQDCMGKLF